MRARSQSIGEVAESVRQLYVAMKPGPCRPWVLREWPAGRRQLHRRYDAATLRAAAMLDVPVPRRDTWGPPGPMGGLFDDRTAFLIEEALDDAGFAPLRPGRRTDA